MKLRRSCPLVFRHRISHQARQVRQDTQHYTAARVTCFVCVLRVIALFGWHTDAGATASAYCRLYGVRAVRDCSFGCFLSFKRAHATRARRKATGARAKRGASSKRDAPVVAILVSDCIRRLVRSGHYTPRDPRTVGKLERTFRVLWSVYGLPDSRGQVRPFFLQAFRPKLGNGSQTPLDSSPSSFI